MTVERFIGGGMPSTYVCIEACDLVRRRGPRPVPRSDHERTLESFAADFCASRIRLAIIECMLGKPEATLL